MAKTAIDAPRTNAWNVAPEDLTLITCKSHPQYDPRVEWPVDENLVKSIMAFGVKIAILIEKDGDALIVVDGRQRVKAALEANKRLEAEGKEKLRIKAFVERGSEADIFGVSIIANENRQDDTPLTRANKAQRLLNMGKTENEVAVAFGVSNQTVKNWLKLQGLSLSERHAVECGVITATAASELSELPKEKQKTKLDDMKAEGGKVTVARTRKAVKTGDAKPVARMQSRRAVENELTVPVAQEGTFKDGYRSALRWVLFGGE